MPPTLELLWDTACPHVAQARAKDSAAVTAGRERTTSDDAKRRYRLRAALVELAHARISSATSAAFTS